ncbi:MAG: MFS transporter permease [Nanoarchaeota archaeon]|nr:MFS transporter permease [Nanoarchaeota archaeon]
MSKKLEERIIPKENAAFRMDKNGNWHNQHEKFKHKKKINFFHESIQKDKNGYYVGQEIGNIREKVYFEYEDTALFVFDVKDDYTLILNTKKEIKLKPKKLYVKDDNLYMKLKKEDIKFVKRGLVNIFEHLIFEGKDVYIKFKGKEYKIKEKI